MSISAGSCASTLVDDDSASCASTVVDEDVIMIDLATQPVDQPYTDDDREKREQWDMLGADLDSNLARTTYKRLSWEHYDRMVAYADLHKLDDHTANRIYHDNYTDLHNKFWTNTLDEYALESQTHLPRPCDVGRWDAINAAHAIDESSHSSRHQCGQHWDATNNARIKEESTQYRKWTTKKRRLA